MAQVTSARARSEKGVRFANIDREVTNRSGSALSAGDVVMLDLAASESEVTSTNFGEDASVWANVIDPTAGGVQGAIFCVVIESGGIADDATGTARFQGLIDEAYVIRASSNIAIGDRLVVTTAKNLDGIRASNEMIVAYAMEAQTTPTTRTLSKVFFDGINGFGFEP